jgi:hypothetical protein
MLKRGDLAGIGWHGEGHLMLLSSDAAVKFVGAARC